MHHLLTQIQVVLPCTDIHIYFSHFIIHISLNATQSILYLTTKYKYDLWFPVPGNNCMSFPLDPTTTEVEEKTEVIYGADNIVNSTLKLFSIAKSNLDNCIDSTGPSMLMIPSHPIRRAHYEMKERGVKIRFITEITKGNMNHCKELMNIGEVRHLDEIKGNFGVLDSTYYRGSAKSNASAPSPLLISSTVRAFVEQQEYFFDMLWKKAIPAKQRIKD